MVQVKQAPAGVEIDTDEVEVVEATTPVVLVVDDQDRVRASTVLTLERSHKVEAPDEDMEFLDFLRGEVRNDILVIVLDVELKREWAINDHSFSYIEDLKRICPRAKILLYTGKLQREVIAISKEYDGLDYLQKPNGPELRKRVAALVAATLFESDTEVTA